MFTKFIAGIAAILAVYVLAAWGLSVIVPFDDQQVLGVILSGFIATINVIFAFLIIYISKNAKRIPISAAHLSIAIPVQ